MTIATGQILYIRLYYSFLLYFCFVFFFCSHFLHYFCFIRCPHSEQGTMLYSNIGLHWKWYTVKGQCFFFMMSEYIILAWSTVHYSKSKQRWNVLGVFVSMKKECLFVDKENGLTLRDEVGFFYCTVCAYRHNKKKDRDGLLVYSAKGALWGCPLNHSKATSCVRSIIDQIGKSCFSSSFAGDDRIPPPCARRFSAIMRKWQMFRVLW